MSGAVSYHGGLAAEDLVLCAYQRAGYRLRARRWRSPAGEIDLVLEGPDGLVFAEVKRATDHARAAQRVLPRQARRIAAAAEHFLAQEPAGLLTAMRFDAALVDRHGVVEIIENAFGH